MSDDSSPNQWSRLHGELPHCSAILTAADWTRAPRPERGVHI